LLDHEHVPPRNHEVVDVRSAPSDAAIVQHRDPLVAKRIEKGAECMFAV
jgi:hypothetical protein